MNRNENEIEFDNLTVIKYIGPKLQSWLREKLQVRTYRDLAVLTIEEIQTQLSANSKPVAKSKIKAWIEEAGKLADEHEKEHEAISTDVELAASKAVKQPGPPKRAGDWKEYASFMVYFESREINGKREKRIKVSHLEKDKSNVWAELTAEHFLWMLNQAEEGLVLDAPKLVKEKPEEAQSAPVEEEPEEDRPMGEAKVNVTKVRLFQPPEAEEPLATSNGNGKSEQQEINASEPFCLEVLFSLGGETAELITLQQPTYTVQAVANEIKTKTGTDLGATEPKALVAGTFNYSVRTPEMTLDPGVHRLWAMVSIQATNTVPNFLEGPPVKVL